MLRELFRKDVCMDAGAGIFASGIFFFMHGSAPMDVGVTLLITGALLLTIYFIKLYHEYKDNKIYDEYMEMREREK